MRQQNRAFVADVNKPKSKAMADEDITLNEDQLLESLEETNGEQETEIATEVEVSWGCPCRQCPRTSFLASRLAKARRIPWKSSQSFGGYTKPKTAAMAAIFRASLRTATPFHCLLWFRAFAHRSKSNTTKFNIFIVARRRAACKSTRNWRP